MVRINKKKNMIDIYVHKISSKLREAWDFCFRPQIFAKEGFIKHFIVGTNPILVNF